MGRKGDRVIKESVLKRGGVGREENGYMEGAEGEVYGGVAWLGVTGRSEGVRDGVKE